MMSSCSSDDSNEEAIDELDLECSITATKGADNDIVGKWKLVKSETFFTEHIIEDYSCADVIYHFPQDGELAISGTEDVPDLENGSYTYQFEHSRLYEHLEKEYILSIEGSSSACAI